MDNFEFTYYNEDGKFKHIKLPKDRFNLCLEVTNEAVIVVGLTPEDTLTFKRQENTKVMIFN